jgi:hypothetical protein
LLHEDGNKTIRKKSTKKKKEKKSVATVVET